MTSLSNNLILSSPSTITTTQNNDFWAVKYDLKATFGM